MLKKIITVALFIVLLMAGGYLFHLLKNKNLFDDSSNKNMAAVPQKSVQQIADSLKLFLHKNPRYNQNIIFLADMKIAPGKNRFFIYSYVENKIIGKGLVAHGAGSDMADRDGNIVEGYLSFGNTPNSLKTSLGKYAIGNSYVGQFGKSYLLYGLDSSNSNAFSRNIVLHSHQKVPENEQNHSIIRSYGCPMVSPRFFNQLEKIIDTSAKKILLYVYY